MVTTSGQDQLGDYEELKFTWPGPGRDGTGDFQWGGAIRNYQSRTAVLFSVTAKASGSAPPDFPDFTSFPGHLHVLSFADSNFSPHRFAPQQTATPWVLFDDTKATAVLSPASDFLVAEMHGDAATTLGSGVNPALAGVPAGWTHRSLLVEGQGIGATVHNWGADLCDLGGKPAPDDRGDPLLHYLGYWTDNGATYYYNYDETLGYAGTLLALRKYYQAQGIPIRYLQLDSWWYQKSQISPEGKDNGPKNKNLPRGTWNAYGGTLDYSASPDLFPAGLPAFHKALGLPLAVHGRWIDPGSPYHQSYKISGVAPVDPRWWDERAAYLASSGVVCYEQDWLSAIYPHSPEMASTPDVGEAFTDNMASAATEHKMVLQYCMGLPGFFLEGSRYSALTNIRTSGDRFERHKWNDFLYTSLLADAIRARPFSDVFMSAETGNLTVATLSAGPLGIGDAMGKESRANLLTAVRADGVIVKPDAPLLPTDDCILSDAQGEKEPLVASTFTNGGVRTLYVLAALRKGDGSEVKLDLPALGITGPAFVLKRSTGTGSTVTGGSYVDTLGPVQDWELYEVAPLGRSGIAFLGDAGLIVGTGRERIAAATDDKRGLTVQVAFAAGESAVTLRGVCAGQVSVSALGGSAGPVQREPHSGLFTTTVTVDPRTPASGATDPVRIMSVTFRPAE